MRKELFATLILALYPVGLCFTQDIPVAEKGGLRPTHTVIVSSELGRPVYRPLRCDHAGNVYFRGFQTGRGAPVVRVDDRGDALRYGVGPDPVLANASANDFSISPAGHVYELLQVGQDSYIVGFDKSGALRSKIKLGVQFWSARVVAFNNKRFLAFNDKRFLVVGTEIQPKREGQMRPPPKLFAGLFNRRGRLIRRIVFGTPPEAREGEGGASSGPPILAAMAAEGQADGKGSIYLMIPSDPVIVDVFDQSANLRRSFTIDLPSGTERSAGGMSFEAGRLAVAFYSSRMGSGSLDNIVVIADAGTGSIQRQSFAGLSLGSFACYRRGDYIFVGTADGKIALRHASAE